jgi:SAM-dependent methyltransferase
VDNLPRTSVDPTPLLRESLARRLSRRSVVTGEITLPAVPSMIDEYVTMCDTIFAGVGRRFSVEELADFRVALVDQLPGAYSASPRSTIAISFDAAQGAGLNYHVKSQWWTVESDYENWISTREPPLFGSEPDARVWDLVNKAADPTTHRVLDIGAGTGRNALALARRGHPVDAVELAPKFADIIRSDAERESLDVRVIQRDVFSTTDDLRQDYQLILLSEVVSDFRTTQQLRGLFELAAHCLAPGGRLVFNAFLARQDYTPDQAARERGQQIHKHLHAAGDVRCGSPSTPSTRRRRLRI